MSKRIDYSSKLLSNYIFEWNAETQKVEIPKDWKELIGYRDEEIDNTIDGFLKTVDEIYHEDVISNVEKLRSGDIAFSNDLQKIRCKDGSSKWFSVLSKPVEWTAYKVPIRFISVYTNITESKEILTKLIDSEERMHKIVSSSYDIIWEMGLDTIITYVSEQCEKILGFKPEEMVGRSMLEFIHPSELDKLKNHFAQVSQNQNNFFEFELLSLHKDGSEIYLLVNGFPKFDRYDNLVGYIGTDKDITARKREHQKLMDANAQLQLKTEELINTNEELKRFAYVASHDLQEPLRMITNFLQLFEKKYQHLVDDTGKKYIHYAVDGSTRMKDLINDLLQYSRAATEPLEITHVDMNEIMKEISLLFRNELYHKKGTITVLNHLPVIKAVRSNLMQIMQNLISNALKFRGEKIPEVIVSSEETNSDWIISVKDSGIGIDPIHAEKIFNVFQRLHLREEYEGTGIGLSICKKLIERYKGKIWVESTLGNGSIFKFSIPKT